MKQRINKFIYDHKRLNALFWWVTKRAVFEVDVYVDAKITKVFFNSKSYVTGIDIEGGEVNKEYIWQKDKRNVQE